MLLNILLAILVIDSVALVGVILLQRSEGGALGMGGGGGGLLSVRGAGDLLTRTTAILAGVFFVLALLITLLSPHLRGSNSVVDQLKLDANALSAAPAARSGAPAPGSATPSGVPPLPSSAAPPLPTNAAPPLPGAVPPLPGSAPQAAPAQAGARPSAAAVRPVIRPFRGPQGPLVRTPTMPSAPSSIEGIQLHQPTRVPLSSSQPSGG